MSTAAGEGEEGAKKRSKAKYKDYEEKEKEKGGDDRRSSLASYAVSEKDRRVSLGDSSSIAGDGKLVPKKNV